MLLQLYDRSKNIVLKIWLNLIALIPLYPDEIGKCKKTKRANNSMYNC